VARRHQRDRLLERAGTGIDAGEVREAPVILRVLVVPERLQRIEVLVCHAAALREVGTDGTELRLQVAGADAEHHPTARQHVEGRHLLGEHEGIALREDQDPRRQPDPCGVGGRPREGQQRVERRVLRLHGRRGHLRVRQHDVLARPHGVEPGGLGRTGRRHQVVGPAHRPHVHVDESEQHGQHTATPPDRTGAGLSARVRSRARRSSTGQPPPRSAAAGP
jgi:hypothetical protein